MIIQKRSRPWVKEGNYGKRLEGDPFYHSNTWKKTREVHKLGFTEWEGKRVSNSLCLTCYKAGKTTTMHTVDHKVAIRDGGDKTDPNNLESVCLSCHNKKSAIEGNKRRHQKNNNEPINSQRTRYISQSIKIFKEGYNKAVEGIEVEVRPDSDVIVDKLS